MKIQIATPEPIIMNLLLGAFAAVLAFSAATGFAADAPSTRPTKETYLRIAAEIEANFQKEILDKFFPVTVDEQGGGFTKTTRWTGPGPTATTRALSIKAASPGPAPKPPAVSLPRPSFIWP